MNKYLTVPNIYIFLAFGHSVTNSIFPNVVLTRLFYVPFYLITIYYIFKVFHECRLNMYMKALTIMSIMICLYSALFMIVGTDSTWKVQTSPFNYFTHMFFSISPIYVFYYFGVKDMVDESWFQKIILLLILSAYANYYSNLTMMLSNLRIGQTESTNNGGYVWAAMLPVTSFFRKKPLVQYILLTAFTMMVIACFKRGAILCAFFIDIIVIFESFRGSSTKNKIVAILAFLTAFFLMMSFVDTLSSNNDYFSRRVEATLDGDSSGRDYIYMSLWDFYTNSADVFNSFFGYGAWATRHYLGYEAHQDWLELLIDYGLLGLVLYSYYWYSFYKACRISGYLVSTNVSIALKSSFILYLLASLFSMSLNDMKFYTTIVIGYCMAEIYKKQEMSEEKTVKYYIS